MLFWIEFLTRYLGEANLNFSRQKRAEFFLLLIALMFGATFPIIKTAIEFLSPEQFLFFRFLFAAVILLPFVFYYDAFKVSKSIFLSSLLLGVVNYFIFYLQALGLETISASRSAFLTSTNLIWIPILSAYRPSHKTHLVDICSIFICLLGMYFIMSPVDLKHISYGDCYTIFCGFFVALHIVMTDKISSKQQSLLFYSFTQIVVVCAISLFALIETDQSFTGLNMDTYMGILFCALGPTVLALYLQLKYQADSTPTRTGLILSLEPVFALFISYFLLAETHSKTEMIGMLLICLSIFWPIMFKAVGFARIADDLRRIPHR